MTFFDVDAKFELKVGSIFFLPMFGYIRNPKKTCKMFFNSKLSSQSGWSGRSGRSNRSGRSGRSSRSGRSGWSGRSGRSIWSVGFGQSRKLPVTWSV